MYVSVQSIQFMDSTYLTNISLWWINPPLIQIITSSSKNEDWLQNCIHK